MRRYLINVEKVTISAAQDIFQIKGAAGKLYKLRRLSFSNSDTGLATAQMLNLRARFLPATVTDGSGGTTPTVNKTDSGDAAASITALANNTTKATTSGTAVVLLEKSTHVYNPFEHTWATGTEPVIGPSQSAVFELLDAPTGTFHGSAEAEVEEIGG